MSAVTQRRPRDRRRAAVAAPSRARDRLEYSSVLTALSELAQGAAGGVELRDALRQLAARACGVLGIERAAVYLRDDARDIFVGCAAHPAAELEEAVRRLVLGGPTDRITREICQTRAPLLIRDTQSDSRALTAAIRRWRLRSLLGVPMLAGGEVLGLLMLDNRDDLHRYTPFDVETATAFASLGAALVSRAREMDGLRTALDAATRQNKLLRRTAMAEHRLSEAVLGGGGLGAIIELVCTLTGKPAALYDVNGQAVASRVPGDDGPGVTLMEPGNGKDGSVREVLEAILPGASATIEPSVDADVRRRHLAAPVDVRGDRWGWLVVMEHPSRLAAFDDFLLRRAATHLALELAGRRQMVSSTADARATLARQLVRGTTVDDDLRRSAEYLGVSLDAHRIVAYVGTNHHSLEAGALVSEIKARSGADVLATRGPEGIALLVEVGENETPSLAVRRVKCCLLEALRATSTERLLAGVSAVCRTSEDVPGGYRVARQVARCIENFPLGSSHRVLAADDLGPGRLFVANGHPEEIARFVDDVLGRLLGDESCSDLVRTLEAFYDSGRSVRLASEQLRVHENTVRYRMSRVHAITGLDVAADADDQLSVQVALLVLRLQGHPALRSLDATAEDSSGHDGEAADAIVGASG